MTALTQLTLNETFLAVFSGSDRVAQRLLVRVEIEFHGAGTLPPLTSTVWRRWADPPGVYDARVWGGVSWFRGGGWRRRRTSRRSR